VKLTAGVRYCSAVKPEPAFKNFLRKGRMLAFVLSLLFKLSASSQTYLPLYTQTNSFEQYTSFISAMLGAKQAPVFIEEEIEQTNWVGGRVLAPGISCPGNQTQCLTIGTTYTNLGTGWDAIVTSDASCTDASPITSTYVATGATTSNGTSLNNVSFNVGLTTVQWTALDGCGATSTCSFTVTVYGVPASSLSAGVINGGTPIQACVGFAVSAALDIGSPAPSGGTPPYSYQWQLNGSNIVGATFSTYTPPAFTTPGNYDYTAVVTDACGRTATTPIKRFTIVADPSVSISGGGSVCLNGTSPIISAIVTDGTGTMQYQWQSGPSSAGPWTNIGTPTLSSTYSPATSPAGITTYYQVILLPNVASCNNATSNAISVTVNSLPSCTISGNNNVCPGSPNTYIGPIAAGLTYQWSVTGNGSISGSSTNSTVSVVAGTTCNSYSINLTVTDANTCTSSCSQTYSVTDNTPPTFTGSYTSVS